MPAQPLHIAIIGAGPGGLALAQGLRKAGISHALYEKNLYRDDYLQAFRLSLREIALEALEALLPPELFAAFLATSGEIREEAHFYDRHLNKLGVEGGAPTRDDFSFARAVSRITLRQILISGLGDSLHLGKEYERYVERPDGRIEAWFADGSHTVCDVLVGADGVGSRVRRQLLPEVGGVDTGARRIAGKVPLDESTRALIDPGFLKRTTIAKGSRGNNLFIAAYERAVAHSAAGEIGGNDEAFRAHPGLLFDNTRSYVMWAYSARGEDLPAQARLGAMSQDELHRFVETTVADWHPAIRQLIALTEISTLGVIPIRSSVPVDPWPTRRATLLGDAIHSMTYFRGAGATTALHDAHLMLRALESVRAGRQGLDAALAAYERDMLAAGFEAVRESMDACERALGIRVAEFHTAEPALAEFA